MMQPVPLAMVICDTVIMDKDTGKKTLVGLFDKISTSAVPCVHPDACIFVSLTEGQGDYNCVLRQLFVENSEEKIMEIPGQISFDNPQKTVDINFRVRGLQLPKLGMYRFDFICEGKLLASRKFYLLPM